MSPPMIRERRLVIDPQRVLPRPCLEGDSSLLASPAAPGHTSTSLTPCNVNSTGVSMRKGDMNFSLSFDAKSIFHIRRRIHHTPCDSLPRPL